MLYQESSDLSVSSVHDLRQQAQYYATDRDEHVAKSTKALAELITPGRLLRARVSALQHQVEDIQRGLAKLRKENTQSVCQTYTGALERSLNGILT